MILVELWNLTFENEPSCNRDSNVKFAPLGQWRKNEVNASEHESEGCGGGDVSMSPEIIFYQHTSEWLAARRKQPAAEAHSAPQPRPWRFTHWFGLHRSPALRHPFEENDVLKIVGISGSASPLSRTRSIIETAIGRVAEETGGAAHLISIADLVPHLSIAVRGDAGPPVEEALRRIETADLLIVGSPVYKGSYTGLLKHLIDLLEYTALAGVPVGLIATGGSDKHALVVEHHLRPLFGFFSARTLPTGLFITDKAIVGGAIEDPLTRARFDQLVREAVDALGPVRAAQSAASAS
jgi:FMN reductase